MTIAATAASLLQTAYDTAVTRRVPEVAPKRVQNTSSLARFVRVGDMVTLLLTRQMVVVRFLTPAAVGLLVAQEVGAP